MDSVTILFLFPFYMYNFFFFFVFYSILLYIFFLLLAFFSLYTLRSLASFKKRMYAHFWDPQINITQPPFELTFFPHFFLFHSLRVTHIYLSFLFYACSRVFYHYNENWIGIQFGLFLFFFLLTFLSFPTPDNQIKPQAN